MEIILFLALLSLLMVVLNCLTIRVIKDVTTRIPGKISILIPMRNEEQNVRGCLTSALNQQGLDDYEVLVLDDNSTDKTSQEIRSFRQVKLIAGSQPPDNWLGKLWACHQLSLESRGDYLVFLDADVRLSRNAVASAISSMKNWDFISPYPRQLTSSFVERIFQPLLQWSWLASVPLIIAQKFSIKSMAVANGQFLIVKRDAYLKAGGHEAVKGEVLDDLMLARQLLSKGFRGGVAEASQVASCQMYQGAQALIRGYRKSLWKAFGSLLGSFVAILLLALTGLIPIIFALTGSELGLIAFLFVFLSRVFSSLRTGSLPNTAILHPVSIILLIGLIIYSWIGRFTNTLTWRDRSLT